MKYRWLPTPPQPLLTARLLREHNLSPLLAQCLVNRQLEDPKLAAAFLEPRLKNLADPFLLPDMSAAVDRLFRARETGERLVIFGDYDVDGVTSSALLIEFLKDLGWCVECYLPHRLAEGYGLTREAVERCLNQTQTPVRLLLAVDCGSNAVDTIAWLRQKEVDVIVLDHHQASSERPPALAVVNPHAAYRSTTRCSLENSPGPDPKLTGSAQLDEQSCFAELCSVGLAFKLAHALLKRGRQSNLPEALQYDLRPLLDLVALGTIADLVPLTGENRILVSAGLERLATTKRPGLIALKAIARCSALPNAHEVGFQLAPRLNAAGRLETAEDSLRLLLAADAMEAENLAHGLESQNKERQRIERVIADEAVGKVRAHFKPEEDFVIVEGDLLWHVGVVGIVASRVLRQFNRPTIIVGGTGSEWRGSGRSIEGFDLAAALTECADLLIRHGGHAMAAGLTVCRENVDSLRTRLNELARRSLKSEALQPVLRLDGEVLLKDLTFECLSHLGRLNPTGQGNPPVQFYVRAVKHARPLQRVGSEKQHVKMWVTDDVSTSEAVWWGGGNESLPVGRYDLAFVPQVNDYKGSKCIQLKVLDWRPSQANVGI